MINLPKQGPKFGISPGGLTSSSPCVEQWFSRRYARPSRSRSFPNLFHSKIDEVRQLKKANEQIGKDASTFCCRKKFKFYFMPLPNESFRLRSPVSSSHFPNEGATANRRYFRRSLHRPFAERQGSNGCEAWLESPRRNELRPVASPSFSKKMGFCTVN